MEPSPAAPTPAPFRVTFVTGVTPDKWVNTWRRRSAGALEMVPVDEAEQLVALRAGEASMAFVRLPVDRADLHVIPLYGEVPVVVVSKEHPVAAYDEIPVADLADEHLLQDPADVPSWREVSTEVRDGTRYPVPDLTLKQAVESVAAQAGIVIVPMSVARLHHRKDVVAVPVDGIEHSQVGLAWRIDDEDPRIEVFVGIVRGRTERSSRGDTGNEPRRASPKKPGKPAKTGSSVKSRQQSKGRRRR